MASQPPTLEQAMAMNPHIHAAWTLLPREELSQHFYDLLKQNTIARTDVHHYMHHSMHWIGAKYDVKLLQLYCRRGAPRAERDKLTSRLMDDFYRMDSSKYLPSLQFLFFPKDRTYFLPLAEQIPSGGQIGTLPPSIIVDILRYVTDGIHSLIGFMLISQSFHQLMNSKAARVLWHSVSAASSKYLRRTYRCRQLNEKDDAEIEHCDFKKNEHTLLQVIQCRLPLDFLTLLLPLYPNWKDEDDRNLFHWLAMYASCDQVNDIASLLLSHGVNIQALDKYNRTPLHYLSLWGYTSLGQFIWDNSKEPYRPDTGGQTIRSEIFEKKDFLVDYFECEKPPLLKSQKYSLIPSSSAERYPKSALQIAEAHGRRGTRSVIPLGGLMIYNTGTVVAAFDTETFTQQRGLQNITNAKYELCNTNRDGVFISASCKEKTLRVWDVRVPEWTASIVNLPTQFTSVDVTGDYVGFGVPIGSFCLDMRNNQINMLGTSNVECCGLSDDKLFLGDFNLSNIQIYNLKTFSVEQEQKPTYHEYRCSSYVTVVRSCGNNVIANSGSWEARWNANDLTQVVEYSWCETECVLNTAFNTSGDYFVAATGNAGSSDHYAESSAHLRNVSTGDIDNVRSVCFQQCTEQEVGCGAGAGVALHLGALWSITSCDSLSVVPNFYPDAATKNTNKKKTIG